MINTIRQYRFYGVDADANKNYNISRVKDLVSGDFLSGYAPVIQLGIQALPGTKFYLNNAIEPIIIGDTGIFELELTGVLEISKIQFDCVSLDAIAKNKNAILIIDTIYISQEEGGS